MTPAYTRALHEIAARYGFHLSRVRKHWTWRNSRGAIVSTPTSPSTRQNMKIIEAKFRRAAAAS